MCHVTLSVSPIDTQTHGDTGMKSTYVTYHFAIQFKDVRRLIRSEDFWDNMKLATLVLKPALVALHYCDGMKGVTVSLLYNLLLELDQDYSKPIQGMDEVIHKKIHYFHEKVECFSCSHSLICFCNGQIFLSEGDGSRGQEGYLVSDGGFF